jgi:oligoribonuclease NrnB/cAMP/cGMP phosphodiesterase (DHH superfamily)
MIDLSKTALVTHKNCCDGSTCAVLFLAAGGKRENVFFSSPNHNDTDELVSDLLETFSGPILIADASISEKQAEKVYRDDVVLLDHHKSAIPLAKFSWCEIDIENTRCGAMMLFDWLKTNAQSTWFMEHKFLVDLVDDHDRWIHNYPESENNAVFHELIGSKKYIDRFLKNPSPKLNEMEQYALNLEIEKRDEYIQYKMKNLFVVEKEIQGHKVNVAFVSSGIHQSRLGNMICEDPSLNVDICVLVGSAISMRSRHNCPVDLAAVAKKLGGGGHKYAAGFSLDKFLNNKNMLNTVIEHKEWNKL